MQYSVILFSCAVLHFSFSFSCCSFRFTFYGKFPQAHAELSNDGCGHSVLGPQSGHLSSKNYLGLYPNNSCEWNIRVSSSLRIVLTFEDLSIEGEDCRTDYLKVLKESKHVYWQHCGGVQSLPGPYPGPSQPLYTDESELTVSFRASRHTPGSSFQLSYSTVDHRDMLTCSNKGIHFSLSQYRKYCPAGCGAEMAAEVAGDVSHGYRHTSVLCKSAVHAGVILDQFGGPITVEEHRGLWHYEPVQANAPGLLLFTLITTDCTRQTVLQPVSASSSWLSDGPVGSEVDWSPNTTHLVSATGIWATEAKGRQWLELDLGEKKRITGILTSGVSSSDHYVKSYKILYKEKSHWQTYTQYNCSEDMIFEGNVDSLYQARNTFRPAIIARYVRVVPLQWHQGIGLMAELLGCPIVQNFPSTYVLGLEGYGRKDIRRLQGYKKTSTTGAPALLLSLRSLSPPHRKKNKENGYDSADKPQTGCWKQVKQPSARHLSTEFTFSYSSEKDPLPKMDLVTSTMADYQQPLMLGAGTVSRKGSTFRPMDTDAKNDANEATSHYDYLHTANQYALPLTNQEPEYATPIIERHTFRKDGFLPDASYSVPGVVLSKSPSFKARDSTNYRKQAGDLSGGYQTPQVKSDRANCSEGIYDSPKVSRPAVVENGACSDYQKPQGKGPVHESYSRPRDCVWPEPAVPHRPDPEGSSLGGT
uniref:Discoidin, CUB and LCCL domain containing 1 n=1 Tax=Electrophorus electricus TaxID=8005 RepID=A0A4W4EUV3_ELEEL